MIRFGVLMVNAMKKRIRADFKVTKKLAALISRNRQSLALQYLDKIIGSDYKLFRKDEGFIEYRRAALQFKIDLLIEWKRYSEALAWTCLECEINPENVFAQAMKKQLKHMLLMEDLEYRLPESPTKERVFAINWDDVAGMRELKLTLESDLILPLLEPEIYRQYKVPFPNGILFYGPPGCGKTFIAKKLASMLKYHFMELKPSDLASIYVHGTQEKIGETFREAQEKAPAIIFFDELDAFIPNRGGGLFHSYSSEVNEFLVQLNDCSKRNILVIGATNYLNRVDAAVRRPGRFDKKIYVGPPDLDARIEAVKNFMKGRPTAKIDYYTILGPRELYSYADLELIVNEAARRALRERVPISSEHFNAAFGEISPSITLEMIREMSEE